MLRQIERLTRPVARAGPDARALAVYAEPPASDQGAPSVERAANEQGFEGVACVDDAARAIILYCHVWRRWQLESARAAAYRLLRFVAYMQDDDGRFVNFIFDWSGRRNARRAHLLRRRTSLAGTRRARPGLCCQHVWRCRNGTSVFVADSSGSMPQPPTWTCAR